MWQRQCVSTTANTIDLDSHVVRFVVLHGAEYAKHED